MLLKRKVLGYSRKFKILKTRYQIMKHQKRKLEQYMGRNNIQSIVSTVHDNLFEHKVIDIFSQLNITISKSDIESCHRLDKENPKNTIVRFVNRKLCNDALEKTKN